ncbi:hypothetical protein HK414_24235 [Ramlibacter terrae]|uniref:Tripartite tricarboxylate transporter substrate binding protein n=1 Tax=Ramlibacter terrae TaxID=2732511 RepID=A0ABX6P8S6_9BURK|nr:hypothetical protein HK414_24235 [Ramlibacter terrae]
MPLQEAQHAHGAIDRGDHVGARLGSADGTQGHQRGDRDAGACLPSCGLLEFLYAITDSAYRIKNPQVPFQQERDKNDPYPRWMASLLLALPLSLAARGYRHKPVKIIVPFTPGSGGDTVARVVADELRKSMGGTFVIDNKPGASGQIGTDMAAKSPADGYTLLQTSSAQNSAGPWMAKKLPYDPLKDFVHIARVITVPFLLVVHPDVPARTVKEFAEYIRQNPACPMGTGRPPPGSGCDLLHAREGKDGQRPVQEPAAGGHGSDRRAGALHDGGPFRRRSAGQGRQAARLAITSRSRSAQFPDIPTLAESGMPEFDRRCGSASALPPAHRGSDGPAQCRNPEDGPARRRAATLPGRGIRPVPNTMPDHLTFVRDQLAARGKRIKDAGIQPE